MSVKGKIEVEVFGLGSLNFLQRLFDEIFPAQLEQPKLGFEYCPALLGSFFQSLQNVGKIAIRLGWWLTYRCGRVRESRWLRGDEAICSLAYCVCAAGSFSWAKCCEIRDLVGIGDFANRLCPFDAVD